MWVERQGCFASLFRGGLPGLVIRCAERERVLQTVWAAGVSRHMEARCRPPGRQCPQPRPCPASSGGVHREDLSRGRDTEEGKDVAPATVWWGLTAAGHQEVSVAGESPHVSGHRGSNPTSRRLVLFWAYALPLSQGGRAPGPSLSGGIKGQAVWWLGRTWLHWGRTTHREREAV